MAHIHNQALRASTQLGVYEIKEASKIDTFAMTYRAWNHHLKEWVEIQEYFPHDLVIRASDGLGVEFKSPHDKENFDYGLKAFLDQAEILTQIEHSNIVKVENIVQFNGTAYLIMTYQEGVSLSKLARSPASFNDETELKFILVSILNALQKVHEYKIVHGGIQPETIILGKNGEPLLTDFTGARLALAAHTAKLVGELATGYTAPELYEQAHKAGPASDFYALGATMYYCMIHNQPAAGQSRIMALSKGEPDPMSSLSDSPGTPYSAALLQAIEWMLRPEYNDRPQSANEILTLLNSEPINNQAGQIASKEEPTDVTNRSPVAKNPLLIGVMAGIIGLVIVGLWVVKKPSEINGDKPNTVTDQPFQGDSGKITVTSEIKEDQSVALSTSKSSQESGSEKIAEPTKNEINEPEKQPKPADEEMRLKTSADDNQHKNGLEAENTSFPVSQSVSKPELKEKITTEQESDTSQQLAVVDKSLHSAKKQNLPAKPTREGSIKGFLASAKKAMKEVRFTTPSGDNAYTYYQMVLAKEPENTEALAGLQKIVDRYAWFIRKSKADGELDRAKRVLQKAESVLPNDPKLHKIRVELADTKE